MTDADPTTSEQLRLRGGTAQPAASEADVPRQALIRRIEELSGELEAARLQLREREAELQRERAARSSRERGEVRARFVAEASGRLMAALAPDEVWETAGRLLSPGAEAASLLQLEGRERVRVRCVAGEPEVRRRLEPLLDAVLDLGTDGGAGPIPLRRVSLALGHQEPEIVPAGEARLSQSGGACMVLPLRARRRTHGAMVVWLRAHAGVGEELLVARELAERIALALDAAGRLQSTAGARRHAESQRRAESDLLSVISHELRTPLTAIISYAELLEEHAAELPDRFARYVRQIVGAAQHQLYLVEQILAYKRASGPGQHDDAEAVDYRELVESVAAMIRPQLAGKPIELRVDLPDAPVHGRCDAGKLRQVLSNLAGNAIRYTERGHVLLSLTAEDEWLALRVEDTGVGIAEHELPRIFDRFWRGAAAAAGRRGMGLGLTITREIVGQLRGTIDVASEPGAGTTFTVRIPRNAR